MTPTRSDIAEKRSVALIINRTDSKCGACGRPTLTHGETHEDISGYQPVPGGGCGVRWRYVTSDYVGHGIEEATREMRPDLEWFDQWPSIAERDKAA